MVKYDDDDTPVCKSLMVKRFSVSAWVDYGRAEYYLKKNDWDMKEAKRDFKEDVKKYNKVVPDRMDKRRELRRSIRTSEESEEAKLAIGQRLAIADETDICYLIEGTIDKKKADTFLDFLSLKGNEGLNTKISYTILDKCNWRSKAAKEVLDHKGISEKLGEKIKPFDHFLFVDGVTICETHECTGPDDDSEIELVWSIKRRYPELSNGEVAFILRKSDWNFQVAYYISELNFLYKENGIYHELFRFQLHELCKLLEDKKKELLPEEDLDYEDFERGYAFHKFCTTYSVFPKKDSVPLSQDQLYQIGVKDALDNKIIELNDLYITQGETITQEMKIEAFKHWTQSDDDIAKKILERVNYNILDGFELSDALKSQKNEQKVKETLSFQEEEYVKFKEDIKKKKDMTEQKVRRISIVDIVRYIGIWTGIDYGRLKYIYIDLAKEDIWLTLMKINKWLEYKEKKREEKEAEEQDTAGKDTAGKDTAGKDTAGKDTAGKDTAGKDTAGKDTAGKGTAGKDTAGKDTAGKGTAGKDTAGKDTAGKDTAENMESKFYEYYKTLSEIDILEKKFEMIIVDIKRYATEVNEKVRVIDKTGKRAVLTEGFEGEYVDTYARPHFGPNILVKQEWSTIYKNGIECGGSFYSFDQIKDLKELLYRSRAGYDPHDEERQFIINIRNCMSMDYFKKEDLFIPKW